jgi:hypothetical protein
MDNYQFRRKSQPNSTQLSYEQSNSTMASLPSVAPPNEDSDEIAVCVQTVLDKKSDGKLIYLDWNAFEPASVLKETELKDIHHRLCPQLEYDNIRRELRNTVAKKRADMLALAKDMVLEKILTECQIQQVKTTTGTMVTSKTLLNAFMKESTDEETIGCITITCFKNSPRWKEDMTQRLIEKYGIHYDERSIVENKNRKGNGFLEKIVTKALNNVRLDLRAVQTRAFANGKPERTPRKASNNGNDSAVAQRNTTSSFSVDDEMNDKQVSCLMKPLPTESVIET